MGSLDDIGKDNAIQQKISNLGFSSTTESISKPVSSRTRNSSNTKWTIDMENYLIDIYIETPLDKVVKLMNKKFGTTFTASAILHRAHLLGLRKGWTPEMEQFLIDNCAKYSSQKLANQIKKNFGRTYKAGTIRTKIYELRARRDTRDYMPAAAPYRIIWTPEADEFISERYPEFTLKELVVLLRDEVGMDISTSSIHKRLIKLGVIKGLKGSPEAESQEVLPEVPPSNEIEEAKQDEKSVALDFPVRKKKRNVFLRIYDAIFKG